MSYARGLRPIRAATSSVHSISLSLTRPRAQLLNSPVSCPLRRQQGARRSIHFSSAVSAALEGSQHLILGLHSVTHTPWFLTIPLVAIGVSLVFRLPFSLYSQKIMQRRAEVHVLLQAQVARKAQAIFREGFGLSQTPRQAQSRIQKTARQAARRLYGRLGLQSWRLYSSFLGIPFWLLAIDSIRRLSGGPAGILSQFLGRAASPPQSEVDVTGDVKSIPSHVSDAPLADPSVASSSADLAGQVLDPSLAVEGCLWFTDLTVADPYSILPLALSVMLVTNALPKSYEQKLKLLRPAAKSNCDTTKGSEGASEIAQDAAQRGESVDWRQSSRIGLQRGLVLVAGSIGFLTINFPAAVHLYWLSSAATYFVFSRLIDRLMPVVKSKVKPCKGSELPFIKARRNQYGGFKEYPPSKNGIDY
ncbi:hypothetical protein GGR56DRAFT_385787 [Xylariaceae sp. FL0804]|nr:hypothetical protein GGR56DRAFT_385787 [Xylariaceae sp. FL0804]